MQALLLCCMQALYCMFALLLAGCKHFTVCKHFYSWVDASTSTTGWKLRARFLRIAKFFLIWWVFLIDWLMGWWVGYDDRWERLMQARKLAKIKPSWNTDLRAVLTVLYVLGGYDTLNQRWTFFPKVMGWDWELIAPPQKKKGYFAFDPLFDLHKQSDVFFWYVYFFRGETWNVDSWQLAVGSWQD